ncbi:YmaD protein [Gracilibacillus boraciitolerans JCM 21714]|uniref:YmaD protein n=1 Tax=Gracilibacillus boraciitolerans JCM 21714 TaxID=1298598 RepID=W4VID2_9BACI|nr:OsmC family protein [Gracilibacillus boraciitolerans]GAE92578.1 YmaD protein [Gracilibacillus boraciitolerans JCM 21714]
MTMHQFKLQASWPGGRNEVGYIESGNLQTEISIPPEMDGPGIGTNPDEMLLGAASTCYLITLAAMIERAQLPLEHLELSSVGDVDVSNGVFTYQRITHNPIVVLKKDATDKQFSRLQEIVKQAESSCMISRAIKGNVELVLEEDLSIS